MKSVIAQLRKDKGLTQAELAEKIGIPRITLLYYEKGSSGIPTMTMLARIAAALETSIEDLYTEETPTEEAQSHA